MPLLKSSESYHIPQLAQYVESISIYKNYHNNKTENFITEGYPEGVFELIFHIGKPTWQKNLNGSIWVKREDAMVSGLHLQSYQLKIPPSSEIMSVRFNRGAFKFIYPGRLNDFINQNIPLVDLWPIEGKKLIDNLKKYKDYTQRIGVLASFIQSIVTPRNYSVIDRSVQSILTSQGMIKIVNLENQSHLSSAQFRKRFREEVGLPPKQFCKVIKINAILSALKSNQTHKPLTELVYDFDYFDQSHFIKDFKSVVGQTPSQFESVTI